MKKAIIILLTFFASCSGVFAQGSIWEGVGTPSIKISTRYSFAIDTSSASHKIYYRNASFQWVRYDSTFAQGGGGSGTPGTVWRTGSGAPSGALGVNGDYYLNSTNGDVYLKSSGTYSIVANLKGATGATGPDGAPGGDTSLLPYTCPELFGAVHANLTFTGAGHNQAYIDANFPGTNLKPSDQIDLGALRMCALTGKKIILNGLYTYYIDSTWLFPKYAKFIDVDLGTAKIQTTNTGNYPVMGRLLATGFSDANLMLETKVNIRDGYIFGDTTSQVGIDLGPIKDFEISNIKFNTLQLGIHLRFSLNGVINVCETIDCPNGFFCDTIQISIGLGASQSPTNLVIFNACRTFANWNYRIAYGAYGSDAIVWNDCVVEGSHCVNVGFDIDNLSLGTVQSCEVNNAHSEAADSIIVALVRIRAHTGIFTINHPFGQHPGILCDARNTPAGSGSGKNGVVIIERTDHWVPNGLNKAFIANSTDAFAWQFIYNNQFRTSGGGTTISTLFQGSTPALCGSIGCGNNQYSVLDVPR